LHPPEIPITNWISPTGQPFVWLATKIQKVTDGKAFITKADGMPKLKSIIKQSNVLNIF
jgi:GTP-binding protein EngB required for normal cell division